MKPFKNLFKIVHSFVSNFLIDGSCFLSKFWNKSFIISVYMFSLNKD
jgi:hypothetical protein